MEFISNNMASIYLWVSLVVSIAYIRKIDFMDIAASMLIGFLWPITMPALVVKRLTK